MDFGKSWITQPPTAQEAAFARETIERLKDHITTDDAEIMVVVDGRTHEGVALPPSALRILLEGLLVLGNGDAVRLLPQHAELTTQEAADLLNLSRPYVVRLLDAGTIPSHKVGTHRRVRLDDVLMYQQFSEADRRDALQKLIAEAQECDLGY
jgi:excisionase family DNA binding protein